jgi:hypothetical protein
MPSQAPKQRGGKMLGYFRRYQLFWALAFVFLLVACNLPISATPIAAPTLVVDTPIVILPMNTATPIQEIPIATFAPSPQSQFTPTVVVPIQITDTPVPMPIESNSKTGPFAVVNVKPEGVLNVHRSNSTSSPVVATYAYDAENIMGTGNQTVMNNTKWVEIHLAGGSSGWVNAFHLTEMIPASSFCGDPQVTVFLDQFMTAIRERNGEKLASLVSPIHGFNLHYLRAGTLANYDLEKSTWLFSSTYTMNWGAHPGSGLDVKGPFSQEVLPKLLDVVDADFITACMDIKVGGVTYSADWPNEYVNINFISLHRSGAPGDELNWRTWLMGIEYVDGKPYLFALNHFFWEP